MLIWGMHRPYGGYRLKDVLANGVTTTAEGDRQNGRRIPYNRFAVRVNSTF